ncbi:hypothetical protein HPP92_006312 [Vanilla planifolia]|uniref:Uncharacterized protein n=1 Tax=Vanilla planifolia TaxID=51239 RepID=A0A835RI63_VANPL|nr:hypothetical protein HPP92_006312 [Vanilla planifolia]
MGMRNAIVVSSPSAARIFLKTLDSHFSSRPQGIISKALAYDGRDMVFADYGPNWKLLRRISSLHLLGPKSMAGWADVRRDEVSRMLLSICSLGESHKAVVLPNLLVRTMANVIGRIALSQRVFDEEGKEAKDFKEMVMELLVGTGTSNMGDLVPALRWLDPLGTRKKMWRIHDRFDVMLSRLLAKHAATAWERQGKPDFLDLLAADGAAGRDEEHISEETIKAFIADLFVAGTDTSAIVIEWAMAEMLRKPSILRRAQEEIEGVVGRHRLLEESDIPNLPYLQAICKETLRLHPPTPLSIPHFASEPCEAGGYRIPGKSWLLVNIWAIGRDADLWANPLEFDPERFLSGDMARVEPNGSDFELIPFGAGRRMCAGKQMGMVMMQYSLGSLVHSFDWSLPEGAGEIDMEERPGLVLPKAVPLSALATPRLATTAYAAV